MSESCSPVSPVRIAVIQYDPQVGLEHCERNLGRGLALARRAAREGANLIVLPELANTGYTFNSRAEAYAHAETLHDGPSLKAWADFAREYQVYLAAGFSERDGLKLYDSAVLFGPEGRLGHYRKAHGSERGGRFLGCSLIAGTNGWPIGEVGSAEAEEILYADVDLSSARSAPIWNNLNDLPRGRRTDLYDANLGYRLHAPMPR
ncbi:nitrilase-related carbon-nitrogen hydrolase [Pseudomonas putida]|uniref:nitrilase-related carbon-nitrogen hydrolase n=1 Tax=Pseudomonas putida TaxID=303 RepID=UPI00216A53C0|nr:nitrilase-related carbon-nitrogen hydrolase [Pseudomonas putida]MCS4061775.1 putative amidohydrolase [Pseudomonas putida]